MSEYSPRSFNLDLALRISLGAPGTIRLVDLEVA
jgi:hypothetical protein